METKTVFDGKMVVDVPADTPTKLVMGRGRVLLSTDEIAARSAEERKNFFDRFDAKLAFLRMQECYGAELRIGDRTFRSDDKTLSAIMSHLLCPDWPKDTILWKFLSGFSEVSREDLQSMLSAIVSHRQSCFDVEHSISKKRDSHVDQDSVRESFEEELRGSRR